MINCLQITPGPTDPVSRPLLVKGATALSRPRCWQHSTASAGRLSWGFREIKSSLQAGNLVLGSPKQPNLVRQEIWGVLIAYTLPRRQMRLMAGHVKV